MVKQMQEEKEVSLLMVRMYRDDTPSLNCSGLEDHLMGSGRFVSDSILPSAGIQTEVL